MLVVLVLEALMALMVFAFYQIPEFRNVLKAGPEEVLTIAIRRYHDDDELRRWIDLIQTEFKCCGARHSESGYQDWQQNAYFNCTPENPSSQRCGVPRSCCIIEPGEYINYMCGFDTTNKPRSQLFDRINTQGCMKGLGQWMSAHDVAIGAVSLAIIVPQILCVVFARLLVQHIQRQRVRWRALHHEK